MFDYHCHSSASEFWCLGRIRLWCLINSISDWDLREGVNGLWRGPCSTAKFHGCSCWGRLYSLIFLFYSTHGIPTKFTSCWGQWQNTSHSCVRLGSCFLGFPHGSHIFEGGLGGPLVIWEEPSPVSSKGATDSAPVCGREPHKERNGSESSPTALSSACAWYSVWPKQYFPLVGGKEIQTFHSSK